MYDLICIGDITVDTYFKGKDLPEKNKILTLTPGTKYKAEEFHDGIGGGAANVAIHATNLGLNCAIVGKVGENVFKQIIVQKLMRKRVSTEFLLYERDFFNISSILLNSAGERIIIHYASPHTKLNLSHLQMKNMLVCKNIFLGHLPGVTIADKTDLAKHFKQHDIKLFINIGRDDIEQNKKNIHTYLQYCDCLILNADEYASLIGKKRKSIDLQKNCASKIKFDSKLLIITNGPEGSYAYFNDEIFHQKSVEVKNIADTTGAGDAFTSGFISTYIKYNDIIQSLNIGAITASKILSKIGSN